MKIQINLAVFWSFHTFRGGGFVIVGMLVGPDWAGVGGWGDL